MKKNKKTMFDPNKTRVLMVGKEIKTKDWNKHLPNPLEVGEKCVVSKQQNPEQLSKGFVTIKRKKTESVFNLIHFTDLKGRKLKWN